MQKNVDMNYLTVMQKALMKAIIDTSWDASSKTVMIRNVETCESLITTLSAIISVTIKDSPEIFMERRLEEVFQNIRTKVVEFKKVGTLPFEVIDNRRTN